MRSYTLILILIIHSLSAKLTIFTVAFNKPEFIALQHKSLQAFLQDDYEQILFINASDEEIARQLISECRRLDISYIRLPVHKKPRLTCHGKALNFALSYLLSQEAEKVVLLENDCFLLRPFSIEQDFQNVDLAYIPRTYYHTEEAASKATLVFDSKICYCNPMFVYLNLHTLPDPSSIRWEYGRVQPHLYLDTGGPTVKYLQKYPDINTRVISQHPELKTFDDVFCFSSAHYLQAEQLVSPGQFILLTPLLDYCCEQDAIHFFHNFAILHYGAGSNTWKQLSSKFLKGKWQHTVDLIENLIEHFHIQYEGTSI